MKLNHDKLHDDIVTHNLKNYDTMQMMFDKIGISKSILQNLRKGCDIRSSILIKALTELDKDLKDYLV